MAALLPACVTTPTSSSPKRHHPEIWQEMGDQKGQPGPSPSGMWEEVAARSYQPSGSTIDLMSVALGA